MFPPEILQQAERVVKTYTQRRMKIATAESCTGGLLGAAITSISGSSTIFDRGFITYSNDAKIDMLGVLPDTLNLHGAVSAETAESMATGAIDTSQADVAVAITGIAGPTGATESKPVGLVYFGLATRGGARFHYNCQFRGNRQIVQLQAVEEGLRLLLSVLEDEQEQL